MITVKQAAESARAFVRELYPEEELRHFRLEEAELDDDGRTWNITLGWVEPAVARYADRPAGQGVLSGIYADNNARMTTERLPRVYKRVLVDAETGEVKSLKIRSVE